ncbi:hypothetical protein BHE74_00037233 [Ensete ventricosum]|nr:hypothetical protein BHE74_00037233 [Ensete ventricosum]RZS25812.1 hypothetical protein BHM03_00059064 [Ensete ventricosum]
MRLWAFIAASGEEEMRRVRRGTVVATVDDSGCDWCNRGGFGCGRGGYGRGGLDCKREGGSSQRRVVATTSYWSWQVLPAVGCRWITAAKIEEEGSDSKRVEQWSRRVSDDRRGEAVRVRGLGDWRGRSNEVEEATMRAGSSGGDGLHGGDGEDSNRADGWQ